jgi:hypothetical protein
MATPLNLDYTSNIYLAVTLAPSSSYASDPASLSTSHSALSNAQFTHVGQVGQLRDVQLYSVPKDKWEQSGVQEAVTDALRKASPEGVRDVEIQAVKMRSKRTEL